MKKKIIFKGAATALITPMKNGAIDYAALERLIELQISGGVAALVVCGTTGEAATLSDAERYELYRFCKEKAAGKTKLVFGTGTNDTRKAIEHTRYAEKLGADGALVVTPYYNKGTSAGIVEHYRAIARSTSLPVMLYNVPARTGVTLSLLQLEALAEEENVVAIKEAADSADRLVELSLFGDELGLYAGADSQIHSVLALGGLGAVSVASNVYPELVAGMCEAFFSGEHAFSLFLQQKLLGFIGAMFEETNPAPVKYALSRLGLCENELRLPLSPVSRKTRELIDYEMSLISGANE